MKFGGWIRTKTPVMCDFDGKASTEQTQAQGFSLTSTPLDFKKNSKEIPPLNLGRSDDYAEGSVLYLFHVFHPLSHQMRR
jgi:hypothetical protein